MTKFAARALAPIVCLVAVLAACGGSGSTAASTASGSGASPSSSSAGVAPSSSNDDGCGLLTDDEVKAVIGVPVTRREASAKTAASFGCVKGTDRTADVANGAFVSFSVFTQGGAALLDQLAGEADTEQISGLGDRALFKTAEGFVFVAKGDKVISVQVFKFGQRGTRDEVLGLARLAVGRA
ncbi:MAG: hypothetical protein QOI95_178 [Acidimicrobiaceae bacterium]|jgi:hypothetical protein